jgi:hypothetical protein
MIYGQSLRLALLLGAGTALSWALPAQSGDKVAASGFADVAFGTVLSFSDQTSSQNLCVFSQSFTNAYSVTANGNGAGGAFELSNGTAVIPFEVLWNSSAEQSGGTTILAGSMRTGFTSSATQKSCNSGPSASASLTIALRSAALASARAGFYSGTLQITIAPE